MRISALLLCIITPAILHAGEVSIQPLQDAYTCDCMPNATNPNGGYTYLYQGRVGNCYCNYCIEWDLSIIEPGTVIDSAEFWIYCKSFTGSPGAGNPIYYMITESWDENTLTYNTLPSWSESSSVTTDWPTQSSWHVIDVTEFVQGWVDGTFENHGVFAHVENTPSTSCPGFYSSNFSNEDLRPYVLVTGTGLSFDHVTWGEVKVSENH